MMSERVFFDEINLEHAKDATYRKLKLIGENIRKLRLKNGLTQADLAFFTFSDKSLISELERGIYRNTTFLSVIKVTVLFGIDLKDLIDEP